MGSGVEPVEQALHHFILALRSSGVRVSTSEALDSFQAVQLVGYDERLLFKHALSATLAKTAHEKERFNACFDRFFSLDDFSEPGAGHRPPLESGAKST